MPGGVIAPVCSVSVVAPSPGAAMVTGEKMAVVAKGTPLIEKVIGLLKLPS